MKLCCCGKVALYKVSGTGYCKTHYKDAVKRRKKWAARVAEPKARAEEERAKQIEANLRFRMFGAKQVARTAVALGRGRR